MYPNKFSRFSKIINRQLVPLISLAKIYNPRIDEIIYSNKYDRKIYTGYMSCGLLSYLLSYQIKNLYPNIKLTPGYSYIGYGKYLEDHTCIIYHYKNEKIIIDPTYKQFLDSIYCDGKSDYSKYLYAELPNIFVGTKEDIRYLVNKLSELELKLYSDTSYNTEDILDMWKFNGESRYEFNLNDLVKQLNIQNSENAGLNRLFQYIKSQKIDN